MNRTNLLLFLITLTGMFSPIAAQERYRTEEGRAHFKSDAPLELIEAASNELRGIIDPGERTFAFSVRILSFQGFNSPLQREHFNENYLDSERYPAASFSGKIIEKTDLSRPGEYTVRAKGKLNIHGVERERIIKSTVISDGDTLRLRAFFTVLLEEHDIAIPKVVYQKIAEEIEVTVEAALTKQAP